MPRESVFKFAAKGIEGGEFGGVSDTGSGSVESEGLVACTVSDARPSAAFEEGEFVGSEEGEEGRGERIGHGGISREGGEDSTQTVPLTFARGRGG